MFHVFLQCLNGMPQNKIWNSDFKTLFSCSVLAFVCQSTSLSVRVISIIFDKGVKWSSLFFSPLKLRVCWKLTIGHFKDRTTDWGGTAVFSASQKEIHQLLAWGSFWAKLCIFFLCTCEFSPDTLIFSHRPKHAY